MDLISLTDGESLLLVRVLGRHMPGVLPWHDFLDAEITVTSGFAQGRLELCLAPDDLDTWSETVATLAAGADAHWMDDGRNPGIRFEHAGEGGSVSAVVTDAAVSGTSVRVPVRLADGWAEQHAERLRRVRAAWPREVVETSPHAYEWRR
ncbi:DUF5959 family protein [Actinacidiphila glaucinigra]|uniref:DUF5959 family protein n=1 Tax=Actinacidiphila glaucinigra TaxID=235986 RepID=UPI0035E1EE78